MSAIDVADGPRRERLGANRRHLLRVADLDRTELQGLLCLAAAMKEQPQARVASRLGNSVACLFEEPSTAAQACFQAAAYRLGMLPLDLRRDELGTPRRAGLAELARAVSSYAAAIAVGTRSHAELEEVAEASSVPVVNAATERHEPCQVLADMLALRERFGRLDGLRIACLGPAGGLAHSLLEAGALSGATVVLAAPAAGLPDPDVLETASRIARREGGQVLLAEDLEEAVRGADAVYLAVAPDGEGGAGPGPTSWPAERALLAGAGERTVFLRCPATPASAPAAPVAVAYGHRSLAGQQAANLLPVVEAVLETLIGGRWP